MRLSDGPQKPAPAVYSTEASWLYVGCRENRIWHANGAGVLSRDRVGR